MRAESPTASILIVEDDTKLARLLSEYLTQNGFEVTVEERGDEAVQRIITEQPTLVVLDIMLPGIDGFEVCRRVRPRYDGGILMLTAVKTGTDQVVGLEIGADDYLNKPIEPRVLLARIRSLVRRLSPKLDAENPAVTLTVGRVTIDRSTREARVDGSLVELTSVEFDLLWILTENAGEVVTREDLHQKVRGIEYNGLDRSVDIHISRIRKKMREGGLSADWLKSVRSVGYLMARQ